MRAATLLVGLWLVTSACAVIEVGDASTTTTTPPLPTTSTVTSTTTVPPTTTTTLKLHRVTGLVTDSFEAPIANATVSVGENVTTTGPTGLFTLATTEPGPISVTKPGWVTAEIEWTGEWDNVRAVLDSIIVRGLHVYWETAGDDTAFQGLLDIADKTAVNTLVFDTKKESGTVLYDTSVRQAHEVEAVEVWYDPAARVAQTHEHGLYAMTRIVTFEDSYWVKAHPEEKLAGGWVDPTAPGARQYNIDLAREACELGFDEIQFDYIRYPSGKTAQISGQKNLTEEFRVGAMASFLEEARTVLDPLGCRVSAAVFGIVVSTEIDHSLGQRPEEMSAHVDAISPMLYPSHYPDGWLGLANPNDHPYTVVAGAIDDALPRLEEGAVLRPWLQAFWWTNEQIRISINAAEERGVGWMLWNWLSNFDIEALPTDEEVAGP